MSAQYRQLLPWVFVVALLTGSMSSVAAPDLECSDGGDALQHWSNVLKTFVNEQGQVDFKGLLANSEDLNVYVKYLSQVSPESCPDLFPTRNARIAHYINSYNALAMYSVVDSGIPGSLGGLKKIWFFYVKKLNIGGKRLSLYTYENDVIRVLGEERVHFALNCMVVSCPRLPQTPFTEDNLDEELDREAWRFFGESRNFQVDHQNQIVRFSKILKFYTDDFLIKSPSLIAYVNRYTDDNIPGNYKVTFYGYDWTVNVQE